MNIKIYQDREVKQLDYDVYGTQNENKVTTLKIEVPEQYENWNKRIVFLTDEGNFWDYIKDNTYTIQNNITKYEELEAYIWLTENAESTEESVHDFRSKMFTLSFFANENAENLTPTEEQIDGFNTILTVLNTEIEEVKQINTDFTKLKEDVEQAEEERNKKLDHAIDTIEDLKEEYNDNAQKKIEEFNKNADEQTDNYNSNAEEKEAELNNIAEAVTDTVTSMNLISFYVDKQMKVHATSESELINNKFYIENGKLGVRTYVNR